MHLINKLKRNKGMISGSSKETKEKHNIKDFFQIFRMIRAKLILAFLVPVCFIVILGIISYFKSKEGLVGSYENNTLSSTSNMAKYLDFGCDMVLSKVSLINNDKILKNYYSGTYKSNNMEEISRFNEIQSSVTSNIISDNYISNIYILSSYGTGISCNGAISSRLVYDNFVKDGEGALLKNGNLKEIWIGIHPYLDQQSSSSDSTYAVSYIRYLTSAAGKPIGCIIVDVAYDFVNKVVSESGMPQGSITAFITKDGREIVSGTVPGNFKFTGQEYYLKAIGNADKKAGYEYVNFNHGSYLFVYSKIQSSGSLLCSLIPKNVIVRQANQLKNITLIIAAISGVLAIALGTFMASGFSNTINKIIKVLKKTESGDLTNLTSIKRKDEFSILGSSINDMIKSMMKLIQKMADISTTVTQSASIVSESSDVLVGATQNISQAVDDIEQGVTQQAVDAEKYLHQMGDLSDRINAVYDNTHNIEKIAGNTKDIVSDGMGIVDNLGTKAKDTEEITKNVISDIESLENESGEVIKIIDSINEIAEQTNLLSLNASIEAARAGEAGRGFSVVADEIRKLADQSVKASGEIGKIIKRIVDKTKKTVNTVKYAEDIVSSQQEALNSTINVFMNINKHVENLTDNLKQIVLGIESIEHAKNDSLSAIESISATSQETAAATEQLGTTADQQLNQVRKLNDVVQQLSNDASNMKESVSVFKI